MAIRKPSWLRSWLNKLNWDIFGWKVYVGDAIEEAIDWALDWINWAISRAEAAWTRAGIALSRIIEEAKELTRLLYREIQKVLNLIDAWWGDLGEWWLTKVTWLKGLIGAAEDFLEDLIDNVARSLQRLNAAWDDFKRDTLPKLIDFSWWRGFWGGMYSNISDWWEPVSAQLGDSFGAITDGIISELNQFSQKLAEMGEFFTDPVKWLYDRLENFMDRYW